MITNLLLYNDLETLGAVAQLARASDCRSDTGGISPVVTRAYTRFLGQKSKVPLSNNSIIENTGFWKVVIQWRLTQI